MYIWPIIVKDRVKIRNLKFLSLGPFPLRSMFGTNRDGLGAADDEARNVILLHSEHRPSYLSSSLDGNV